MNFFKMFKPKKVKDAAEVKETVAKETVSKEAELKDTQAKETVSEASKANNTTINSEEQKRLFKAAYGGQCGVCTFAKLVSTSKDSHFIMCSHPQLPKYQGQPVLNCNFVDLREASTN